MYKSRLMSVWLMWSSVWNLLCSGQTLCTSSGSSSLVSLRAVLERPEHLRLCWQTQLIILLLTSDWFTLFTNTGRIKSLVQHEAAYTDSDGCSYLCCGTDWSPLTPSGSLGLFCQNTNIRINHVKNLLFPKSKNKVSESAPWWSSSLPVKRTTARPNSRCHRGVLPTRFSAELLVVGASVKATLEINRDSLFYTVKSS